MNCISWKAEVCAMDELFASEIQRVSCASCGHIFRKPALSTDQFKLKVISRSKLYIYTLNVSCIMLVYYFVPFIVNNRYLLF